MSAYDHMKSTPVIIRKGERISEPLELGGIVPRALELPPEFTGDIMTFAGCDTPAGESVTLKGQGGRSLSTRVVPGQRSMLDIADAIEKPYLVLAIDTPQTQDVTIPIYYREA